MDSIRNMPRDAQIVLGAALVYAVLSVLTWQEKHVGGFTVIEAEWYGIGIAAGFLGWILLAWEIGRGLDAQVTMRSYRGLISLVLALALVVLTVITFATLSDRQWAAWAGLLVSLVIAVAAGARARREGVRLPHGA